MTLAWYGHLRFDFTKGWTKLGIFSIVLISWLIAFFEYCFQVPANRLGYEGNGGPFNLVQLKVIQEVITLMVFILFSSLFFKNETIKTNHIIAFVLMAIAVYLVFKK